MADGSQPAPGWKATVLEAMVLLVVARLLVAGPPLRMWMRLLGKPHSTSRAGAAPSPEVWALARAVDRATQRLPFDVKCLPRAIALHWMLRRRGEFSELVISVLHPRQRGMIETLHAWVEMSGTVIIGKLDYDFVPIARLT